MLDVGDGHVIYVEQCGNPDGVPVVVFHGGPGGGCSPMMRRYFDPDVYRVILFDQRGCGRSRPHACVEHNTTWHLIDDIEVIRSHLDIERWIVFGGSWGATLSLLYAQSHPGRVIHLVLRGVFLMTRAELDWFYGGGVSRFFPCEWKKLIEMLPEDERADVIAAYHKRLFCRDFFEETQFARAWAGWENALAALVVEVQPNFPADYARAFARLENHYFINNGFLEYDDYIIANRHLIEHLPATVVQGRYDMVCPPASAFRLVDGWDGADLRVLKTAGHALSEPAVSSELIRVMDALKAQVK